MTRLSLCADRIKKRISPMKKYLSYWTHRLFNLTFKRQTAFKSVKVPRR